MATRSDITPELCRQLLRYEPETGKLFWRERSAETCKGGAPSGANATAKMINGRMAGNAAGTMDPAGYIRVRVCGVDFQGHRLAWAVHFGSWPNEEIDHINGIKSDNRIANLRAVSRSENMKNRSLYCSNSSGTPGVTWNKARGKWQVEIRSSGQKFYIGLFATLPEAVAARLAAEVNLNFHPNHGRS